MAASFDDHQWGRRSRLLHRARLSALYHRAAERLHGSVDRWSRVLAMVAGSAALVQSLNGDVLSLLLAGVAVTSAIGVVFDPGSSARKHADLAAQWTVLEADIERAGEYIEDAKLIDNWIARRAEIESLEPPPWMWLIKRVERRIAAAGNL